MSAVYLVRIQVATACMVMLVPNKKKKEKKNFALKSELLVPTGPIKLNKAVCQ